MSYSTSKQIRIHHEEDNWDFVFSTDEYGSISVHTTVGGATTTGNSESLLIPKDCLQLFIKALEELND